VPWDGTLASAGPAGVRYALSPLPAASAGARSYELAVAVEAVLADGTVLRSETTYLTSIAVEPHMVT
jgi:hypothetical protein